MTWPFENDTSVIERKLAKRSLAREKRRNLMVVIAVALAAFLICFTGITSVSIAQILRNQVADTYEAVFTGVTESDVTALKGLPEFARVGEYYLLGQEHDRRICSHPEYFPYLCERQNTKLWAVTHHWRNIKAAPAYCEKRKKTALRHWNPVRRSFGYLKRTGSVSERLPRSLVWGVVILTAGTCRFMVAVSVRRPVKIAAGIPPLQAVRFLPGQEKNRGRSSCLWTG